MRWPEPGTAPTVAIADIPVGAAVDGMAPVGLRWSAKMTRDGIKPDGNCPRCEFSPCFVEIGGVVHEIKER